MEWKRKQWGQMTYEEFKRELRWNVQNLETAQGKSIRLLERQMVCSDPVAVHMMNVMNRCMYGREHVLLREDMLCVLWIQRKKEYMQHWLVQPLYERYRQEGWQGILPEISAGLTESGQEENKALLTGENVSYAVCRRYMIVRPVNFEHCRQELGNAIYHRMGDIALVIQLMFCEKRKGGLTLPLSRDMVQPWKLTEEQLLREAMMNTCYKMPPRLFLGGDRRKYFPYHEGILLPEEEGRQTWISPWNHREAQKGYLLTNTGRIGGAVAFFYPGVRDILARRMDGDYYVVFPSTHEAIVHPKDCTNDRELRATLQHINAVYGEGDMLSERVFFYHRKRRLLQLL